MCSYLLSVQTEREIQQKTLKEELEEIQCGVSQEPRKEIVLRNND